MTENPTRLSSVSLIVLGVDLDPSNVTRALGIFPDQSWRKGDVPQTKTPDGRLISHGTTAEWGGWKKFMPPELRDALLEDQLEYWAEALQARAATVRAFVRDGHTITLDCYLSASEYELTELKSSLLQMLAATGADVDIHFYPDDSAQQSSTQKTLTTQL